MGPDKSFSILCGKQRLNQQSLGDFLLVNQAWATEPLLPAKELGSKSGRLVFQTLQWETAMVAGVTDPQPLAWEEQWEMRGWARTVLLCSCWSCYEGKPVMVVTMTHRLAIQKLHVKRRPGTPTATALNDQLLWFIHSSLPRVSMYSEAGLRQFWHPSSLDPAFLLLYSVSSVLGSANKSNNSLPIRFILRTLPFLSFPAPELAQGHSGPLGRSLKVQGSLFKEVHLFLEFCIKRGVVSTGLFYRQRNLGLSCLTYKNDFNDYGKNKENHPR